MKRYWGVRMGEGGIYADEGENGNYIAIGWNELGDLSWLAEKGEHILEKFKEIYARTYPKESELSQGINRGQVLRFVKEMRKNDIVLVPDPIKRKVLIGRVTGEYEYRDRWEDACPYLSRRAVEWIKIVNRDYLPEKLKTSIGALLTVFSLDPRAELIEEIITGRPRPRKEGIITGKDLVGTIIDRLYDLKPREFEEFVKHILSIVGFEAAITSYVADGGVDAMGKLNAEGLAEIMLRVQVKRITGNVGIGDVLKIRGALTTDEHGAIISLSGFTKGAREEAEQVGKRPISLIDGETLAELILKHYEELDDKYKNLLKIEKKEVPIWEQYYAKT